MCKEGGKEGGAEEEEERSGPSGLSYSNQGFGAEGQYLNPTAG